ncbi:MAG TPA: DUF11 domain-containing protein, partial [Planctomycetaceae bacterium]|nr:DUF11 domain-containing protein [Planctomycetaceae bacterium]
LLTNDNILETEFAITNISIDGGADQDPTGPIDSPGTLTLNAETGAFTFDPGTDFDYLAAGQEATITVAYEVTEWDDPARADADITGQETGTLTITITGVNDPPTIDLDADNSSGAVGTGYQGTYLAGAAAAPAVDSDLVITDLDHTELQSATITLTNPQDGADESLGITVPDPGDLPPGVTVDTSDPHVITITGPVSVTDLQTWLATLTYQNLAATPTTGVRTITIEVSDGSATGTATSMMTVLLSSDLAISASGTPTSVIAGETITYSITATNNGPNDATGVRVVGLLPAGTTFDSATPAIGTTYNAGTWTIGNLASGASVELTLTVLVDPSLADGSMVVNTGTIETTNVEIGDSDSGNNSLNESTDISRQAELGIAVSGPTLVAAEAEITYTITLTNSGPSDASNITVNVPVPTGTTYDAGNTMFPPGTTYDQTDWVIPSLAAGESVILTLVVDVNPGLVLGPGNELSLTATIAAFDEYAAEVNDPDDNSATLET